MDLEVVKGTEIGRPQFPESYTRIVKTGFGHSGKRSPVTSCFTQIMLNHFCL